MGGRFSLSNIILLIVLFISIYNLCTNIALQERISSSCRPVFLSPTSSSEIYPIERIIPIVAVSNEGKGIVGSLKVKLIPGNNNVLINTNPFLETDIQYSANKAVTVAKLRANKGYDLDYIFDFKVGNAKLIGGESAGAAMTVAVLAALENKSIRNDTVITGVINPDGTIGKVGGIIEKAKAVADAGYKYFLLPKGQSKITYYEKQITKEPIGFGFEILNTVYVPKTLDLKKVAVQEWGLQIIEVSTVDEAVKYFLR